MPNQAWRDEPIALTTERLRIRAPEVGDAARLSAYCIANREHLVPWEPPRPTNYATLEYWERAVPKIREERRAGKALVLFWELLEGPAEVIGMCRFSTIVRGPFLACNLGYSVGAEHQGKGYMTEALRVAISYVFREVGMHRIMANYIPSNSSSARLLARLGFEREGLARNYLYIDGQWRDHVLTALTNPDPITPDSP